MNANPNDQRPIKILERELGCSIGQKSLVRCTIECQGQGLEKVKGVWASFHVNPEAEPGFTSHAQYCTPCARRWRRK